MTSELQLDAVRHGENEVFEFGESKLIKVKCEGKLSSEEEGQLSKRHPRAVLSQNLNQRCLHNIEFRVKISAFNRAFLGPSSSIRSRITLSELQLPLVFVDRGGPHEESLMIT